MQRPFQFNLAILTAKNLACVGHTLWYKNQQIPMLTPNRGCTSGIHHHKRPNVKTDGKLLQMGHWLMYGRYMAYTTDTPAKNTNDHQKTVLVCAWYLQYTRCILPFTDRSGEYHMNDCPAGTRICSLILTPVLCVKFALYS